MRTAFFTGRTNDSDFVSGKIEVSHVLDADGHPHAHRPEPSTCVGGDLVDLVGDLVRQRDEIPRRLPGVSPQFGGEPIRVHHDSVPAPSGVVGCDPADVETVDLDARTRGARRHRSPVSDRNSAGAKPVGAATSRQAADAQDPRRGLAERAVDTPAAPVDQRRVECLHDPRRHHEAGRVVGGRARQHRRLLVAERVEAQPARRLRELLPAGTVRPWPLVAERRHRSRTRHRIRRCATTSSSRPYRATTPGRYPCTTTSASIATWRSAASWSASVKSAWACRLPWPVSTTNAGTTGTFGPRTCSTSAPNAASVRPHGRPGEHAGEIEHRGAPRAAAVGDGAQLVDADASRSALHHGRPRVDELRPAGVDAIRPRCG